MVLYIDETENNDYFIVTGLLVTSKESVDLAYKHFKKKINTMKINPRKKEKVFNEFKSTILDREFQKIKLKMLNEIMQLENQITYSCYIKKESIFNQVLKEKEYICLLNNIVSSISSDIEILFDAFNKDDFEEQIIKSILLNKNVISIEPRNSFDEAGIQFVDNLCSVIRQASFDEDNEFYQLIKDRVVQV